MTSSTLFSHFWVNLMFIAKIHLHFFLQSQLILDNVIKNEFYELTSNNLQKKSANLYTLLIPNILY